MENDNLNYFLNKIDFANLPPDTKKMYDSRSADLNERQKKVFDTALSKIRDLKMVEQFISIAHRLNPEQLEAVFHDHKTDGPLLIFAGAGSGKTTALTYRIIYLILSGINAENILALTFTVKASEEMRSRIRKFFMSLRGSIPEEQFLKLENDISKMWVGTFHSICLKILKEELNTAEGRAMMNCELVGLPAGFKILENSYTVLKPCFDMHFATDPNVKYDDVSAKIDHWKNELLKLDTIKSKASREERKYIPVYEKYQNTMKQRGLIDFNDMIILAVELFEKYPEVLLWYRRRFKYVLIDEYQDTNYAQYVLCKKLVGLAGGHRDVNYTPPAPSENLIGPSTNLFVVGDDDQSIYEWRGADIRNILFFEKDFPNCKTVKLVKNYRSTANIITAANEVFKGIKEKHLIKQIEAVKRKKDGSLEFGDAITVYMASDETDEINFIVFEMNEIRKKNPAVRWNDFAVLYRVHEQSKIAKRVFENQGIPYIVYNPRFWQLREVQDICSYLKVLAFYLKARAGVLTDAALSKEGEAINDDIKRMYYLPPLNFSPIETEIMSHTFKPYELFTNEEMRRKMLARLPEETSREKFLKLVEIFSHLADDFKMSSLENTVSGIIESCDYLSVYKKNVVETEQSRESVRYVMAVREEAVDFDRSYGANIPVSDRLSMFLENIAIRSNPTEQSELKTKSEYVNLMSLHAAKGLEFNTVFFIGLEENIIPIRHYSAEKLKKKDKERRVDEERRLFYVGITRAKERLYLTYADSRLWYSKKQRFAPSRFLACLPKRLLDRGSFNVGFFSKMKYGLKRIFS